MCCLQEKENPDYAKELKKADVDYERKRDKLQTYFGKITSFSTNPSSEKEEKSR